MDIARADILRIAALVHRISGFALAVFLPVHFLFLGQALEGAAHLDRALDWTLDPRVKIAEAGLVALLGLHLLGGLRILFVENFAWNRRQRLLAAGTFCAAVLLGCGFLLQAIGALP